MFFRTLFQISQQVLGAIASGAWLLDPDWIVASLAAGRWLNENPYELAAKYPNVQVGALAR